MPPFHVLENYNFLDHTQSTPRPLLVGIFLINYKFSNNFSFYIFVTISVIFMMDIKLRYANSNITFNKTRQYKIYRDGNS